MRILHKMENSRQMRVSKIRMLRMRIYRYASERCVSQSLFIVFTDERQRRHRKRFLVIFLMVSFTRFQASVTSILYTKMNVFSSSTCLYPSIFVSFAGFESPKNKVVFFSICFPACPSTPMRGRKSRTKEGKRERGVWASFLCAQIWWRQPKGG